MDRRKWSLRPLITDRIMAAAGRQRRVDSRRTEGMAEFRSEQRDIRESWFPTARSNNKPTQTINRRLVRTAKAYRRHLADRCLAF
jgi:hypothetical protein